MQKARRRVRRIEGVCERLNDAMYKKGVSGYRMARDLRIDYHTVHRITHGDAALTEWQLARICPYLGISADWLLGIQK